ncbi:MAG: phytoene/squalene synthase family protein [Candidatus Saccharimonadales bacterium]
MNIVGEGNFTTKLLVPRALRLDAQRLHDFVATASEYSHGEPPQTDQLHDLIKKWHTLCELSLKELEAGEDDDRNTRIVKGMCRLKIIYGFETEWIDAFLASMLTDARPMTYHTLGETLAYVYGSAEVVGFMVAKLLRLPKEALPYAALQARALQWVNFLSRIGEDSKLGRCYIPREDIQQFELKDVSARTAYATPEAFKQLMHFELNRFWQWKNEAESGMAFVPRRSRVPIQVATDTATWTARRLAKDPLIVFQRSLKPKKSRILRSTLVRYLD